MIHYDDAAIDFAMRVALISNTPAFLLKRLKEENYAGELAKKNKASELFQSIKGISGKPKRTSTDLAAIYLAMIALSYKSEFDFLQLRGLDLSKMRWIEDIIRILMSDSRSCEYKEIYGEFSNVNKTAVCGYASSNNSIVINSSFSTTNEAVCDTTH